MLSRENPDREIRNEDLTGDTIVQGAKVPTYGVPRM